MLSNDSNHIQTVGYENETVSDQAHLLAKQLSYTLDKNAAQCLFVGSERLALKIANFSPLSADFTSVTWNKRRAEGKKQGLVQACKPKDGIKIIDATAGWGRDAAILASFGAEVLMLERHPMMAAILSDALKHQNYEDKQRLRLSLSNIDAYSFLSNLKEEEYPDVIYIDPMHPERNKSALVKKKCKHYNK